MDAIATAGLFGAVSGSTLAAALTILETEGIEYEAWAAALYPFMDIPALVTAIVLASIYISKQRDTADEYLSKQKSLSKQRVTAGGYSEEPGNRRRVGASRVSSHVVIPSAIPQASGSRYGPSSRKASRVPPCRHCCSALL